ncbi:MAG: hypothetical protein ACREQF_06690 [Candidatus Binataceae bacterium]
MSIARAGQLVRDTTIGGICVCAVIVLLAQFARAESQEPRPWLCRDKPVVSDDRAMRYEFWARDGRQWQIFFMVLTPTGGHDGFTVVRSDEPRASEGAGGVLPHGRYFAVALYRSAGGKWTCPGNAHDERRGEAGVLRNFCYGDGAGACAVGLKVRRGEEERK